MNRRLFLSGLSLAPLLVLPEPRRVYSFLDGWAPNARSRETIRRSFERHLGVGHAGLAWDAPFSVAGAAEAAIMRGGGELYPHLHNGKRGFGVLIEANAYVMMRGDVAAVRIPILT